MSAEDLEARLKQEQSAKALTANMSDLGNELKMSLLPVGKAFLSILSAISPVLKIIGSIVEGMMIPFTAIGALVGLLGEGISIVIEKLEFMKPVMQFLSDNAKLLESLFVGIGTALTVVMIPALVKAGWATAKLAWKGLAAAASFIMQSFAGIPGGFGIPLGIAAVAGLAATVYKFNSAGDMNLPSRWQNSNIN
jgi:hypothetical protein